MARCWVGRIAVSEHIPGLLAYESRIRARGRRKDHGGPGVASGWAARLDQGRDRGSPARFMDGLGATGGPYAPLGGVERPRWVLCFARLNDLPVRVLGGPTARAACGTCLLMAPSGGVERTGRALRFARGLAPGRSVTLAKLAAG